MVTGSARRSPGPRGLSRAAWLYASGVIAAAAWVLVRTLTSGLIWHGALQNSGALAVLAVLFLVCDSTPTLTSRQSAWSPSSSATLAAVVLLGPAGAVAVGATSLLSVRKGLRFTQRVFNAAMYALSAYAAAEAYLALGGHTGRLARGSYTGIIGPFAVAALVHVLVNHGLLWGMLALIPNADAGHRKFRVGLDLPVLIASDLGYASLGLLVAALWN